MTRDRFQSLIKHTDEANGDFKLVLKQGEVSTEYLLTVDELAEFKHQLEIIIPSWTDK